ncbi:hypothetical protein PR048_027056 [Dryococelus australis]|uniref:Uncharacterized protein n=1 Tax=Dryococelus australis TaxID=614101 RepID=A0ABQ9GED2_9NEOP|nr:hypothetical protein PR048_027056 [Dryococelus australis]
MDGEEYHANDSPANTVAETPVQKSRKRKRRPETWKRNVAKQARYRSKGFPVMPSCGHETKASFQCHQLLMQDVRKIHQKYYANADLESKENYILQHVAVSSVKISHLPEGQSRRQLPRQRQGITGHVKVCRKAFLAGINQSRDRVQRLCQLGITPPETRGGVHLVEKYKLKRTAVKEFREKPMRQYLSSQLNVKKMWGMYLEKHMVENLRVEYEFFRTIFNENSNISFNAPYTDKCSTCMSLENKINDERDMTVKHNLQIELLAHKKGADTFCQKFREKCDKVFRPPLKTKATHFYLWTEDAYAKGSNQIASSLHHNLNKLNLDEVTTIRLFSDGCGGQNKYQTIIGMLSRWVLLEAPTFENIVLLPPDRVFENLERHFRHESIIENPEMYIRVFNKFGTVINFGKDCAVSDWKLYSKEILKPCGKWHFHPFITLKTISKKDKTFRDFQIPDVVKAVRMKDAKINYVSTLLTIHFGEKWE